MTRTSPAVDFMTKFAALREAVDDAPKRLLAFSENASRLVRLARDVQFAWGRIAFVSTVRKVHPQASTAFIEAEKLYRHKWQAVVEFVLHRDTMNLLSGVFDEPLEQLSFESFEKEKPWRTTLETPDPMADTQFDPSIHDGGQTLRMFMDWADSYGKNRLANQMPDDADIYTGRTCQLGVEAFDFLEKHIGIDLSGVFERWNKLPVFYIPKHVSDRHGLEEKGSLFGLLDDAMRAYVTGAFGASVAMCRATLEIVLKEHFLPGETGDLHDIINLACSRYEKLDRGRMHSIRKLGNEVLHRGGALGGFVAEEEALLLQSFKDLKFWIESAPTKDKT